MALEDSQDQLLSEKRQLGRDPICVCVCVCVCVFVYYYYCIYNVFFLLALKNFLKF